jgi:uncharacterized protein YciI
VRAATRPLHVAYTQTNGKVKFGGPFTGPEGEMIGSFSIIEAKDYDEAQAYVKSDPYNQAGLFERQELHSWKLSINSLDKV